MDIGLKISNEGEDVVIRLRKRRVRHALWIIIAIFSIAYGPSILFTIADDYNNSLHCWGWVVDHEFNSGCLIPNAEEEMFIGEGLTAVIKPEYRDQRFLAPLMARTWDYSLRIPWSRNLAQSIRSRVYEELLPWNLWRF